MNFDKAEAMFGLNFRHARERAGLSQTELAKRMSTLGFRWHQATVYKVESGDRPVKLGEALALENMLQVPLRELTAPPESFQAERWTKDATVLVVGALDDICSAATRYSEWSEKLRRLLKENADAISEAAKEKANQALSINPADLLKSGEQAAAQREELIRRRPSPGNISKEEQVLDYNLPSLIRRTASHDSPDA